MLLLLEKIILPVALKVLEIYLKREPKVDPKLEAKLGRVFNEFEKARSTEELRRANASLQAALNGKDEQK